MVLKYEKDIIDEIIRKFVPVFKIGNLALASI